MDISLTDSFGENKPATLYEEGTIYIMNINVPAMAANATPACAARADTVPSTSAPPELLEDDVLPLLPVSLAFAAESAAVPGVLLDGETNWGVAGVVAPGSTVEDVTVVLGVGTAEVAFAIVVLPAGLVALPPLR
jgi:hypothetical protein